MRCIWFKNAIPDLRPSCFFVTMPEDRSPAGQGIEGGQVVRSD
jgi:hypothetical protein